MVYQLITYRYYTQFELQVQSHRLCVCVNDFLITPGVIPLTYIGVYVYYLLHVAARVEMIYMSIYVLQHSRLLVHDFSASKCRKNKFNYEKPIQYAPSKCSLGNVLTIKLCIVYKYAIVQLYGYERWVSLRMLLYSKVHTIFQYTNLQ